MQLTSVAIKRPLFMLMVIGALLIVGLVSWTRLGVDLLPALDFPIVVVTTVYPGASPAAVDTLVTKKVEDAVASINDIDYIQSSSVEGLSSVLIFFTDKAAKDSSIDVERRVSAIRGQLPTDVRAPSVGKYDPNAQPILQLTVSGNRDLGALQRIGEDKLQKRLEGTNGVAQVSLIGGLQREIQVQVDQQRLQARGLSILQVNQALSGDNLNMPAGSITQQGKDFTVRQDNQAQTPAELNNIMVASTATGPVYLKDVATVVDTYKKVSNIQRTNGQPALGISVLKQATANTVETADAVKRTIAAIQPELPADVKVSVASDASVFTRSSLQDVQDYISLSNHQANSNLVIIGGDSWAELSEEQQDALTEAVDAAEEQVPGCVAEDEEKILAEWEESGAMEVVDDVDVDAFRTQADEYLRDNFTEDQLAVYEAIRGTAE